MDLTDEELNAYMDAYENASVDNQERVTVFTNKLLGLVTNRDPRVCNSAGYGSVHKRQSKNKLWYNVCEEI